MRRLGVDAAVAFTAFGRDERDGLGRLIAAADAVVLLSEYEAHPVAVMEALAMGRDTLVARTSGLVELGEAGLVDLVDLDASTADISRAILATTARRRWKSGPPALSTWDGCVDELLATYKAVIG